jgi:hypothetical protein
VKIIVVTQRLTLHEFTEDDVDNLLDQQGYAIRL